MDQPAKETPDHDIDQLTTVHYADLKPLVNSYILQEVQIKRSVSPETNTKTTQGISTPDQSWGGCDNPTPNWPYQGHKIPYIVPRTTNCLPALWPDSDNWAYTSGMYSVATKSWWVRHSWLIEDPLWDDPRGLHIKFLREAGFYYLIWMAIYPIQLFIQISHQLTTLSSWINPHYWTPPLESVYRALAAMGEPYLWRKANMSRRACVVVKQIQANPNSGPTTGVGHRWVHWIQRLIKKRS